MTSAALEAYLSRLERELRKRGLQDKRIVDEAREHLFDALEDGLQRGLSVDAAENEALMRFGPPEIVAVHFAAKRNPMSNWLFFILTRLTGLMRRNETQTGDYHDVGGPSRIHFGLRLRPRQRKRFHGMSADGQKQLIGEMRERGEDVSAFETDPRERLVQFLLEFGRRTFGSSGTLESLTLLEDTTDSNIRGGRYLVAFASGTKMIWTVALSGDGGVSFDGTNAPA
jgi:HAAS